MRALVIYESMYGNTKAVAQAIAKGVSQADPTADVSVMSVQDSDGYDLTDLQLLIVGGPTHAWSMSRPNTRVGAMSAAHRPDSGLHLEDDVQQAFGVREWLQDARGRAAHVAAFDTRRKGPAQLTGRASSAIARRLRRHSDDRTIWRESFLVDRHDQLVPGELHRAQTWGYTCARDVWHRMVNASIA